MRISLISIVQILSIYLVLLIPTSSAHAATYNYSNTSAAAIPDNFPTCSTSLTRTFNVPESYIIGDVNLGVSIQHAKRNDLEIYLSSPSGKEILLMSAATSPSINVNYFYDDEASISYETGSASGNHSTTAPPYQFTARPPQALGIFDGENAQGTWSLRICDNINAGITGSFQNAQLVIESTTYTPPPAAPNITLSCQSGNLTAGWSAGNPASSTAGAIGAQITTGSSAGASWAGVSNGSMNTINAWSDTAVQGRTSWQNVFYWDTTAEPGGELTSYDMSQGTITFSWPRPVTNPLIHIDRVVLALD